MAAYNHLDIDDSR